ncbi:type I restriction-modification system subunit M [Bombilactobacillus bombi]|uniref:type I restriction-modification system subunit M n=1 Tax=Bombilactobacillus bombi TaxID=1303590 RepID=UPI0015E615FB|nr:type I restriction-modification system subunit M [Bombilactobacillus bombi]MBA1433864.1 type I restriction-modification system subunit M [Bombilactobacillus bombi]
MSETTNLENGLFSAADVLRSKMDASQYKNYLLGTVFYKYLSDSLLYEVAELLEDDSNITLEQAQAIYEENATDQDLLDELKNTLGYWIDPADTYTNILKSVQDHTFQLNQLGDAFTKLESRNSAFEGLFEDYDLHSKRLGNSPQKQADTIAGVLAAIGKLELVKTESDSLGDAYEYLISQFASESGKKAGEFYTPQKVSELLTRLTLVGKNYQNGMAVYDPAMGSGSLLLNFRNYVANYDRITYFGQEINTSTFNLARMNMILHHVELANQYLRNGDTLDEDWPAEEVANFDAVVMNPPYSLKWSANEGFLEDPRFAAYGVLPPKSKADYAFLLHGYYHLKHSGTMAIVLPHGILFRGGSEGKIRQKLLENGSIDAVIGLPANLFYSTGIPTTIVVLKKDKQDRNVFFIDASKDFEKVKTQNVLREEDVLKILDTYEKRQDVDKYAHLATFEEIQKNDFNLNIPRYVDTFEAEPPVDVDKLLSEMQDIKKQEAQLTAQINDMMADLVATTPEAQKTLDALKKVLK